MSEPHTPRANWQSLYDDVLKAAENHASVQVSMSYREALNANSALYRRSEWMVPEKRLHMRFDRGASIVTFWLEETGVRRSEVAMSEPRKDEDPFSEGFWAGRMSDPGSPTSVERERAYQAYMRGERWNRTDGNRTPLQHRFATPPGKVQKAKGEA